MERSPWLDTLHGQCSNLTRIARRLDTLSMAFEMTGNERLADELADMARDLAAASKALNGGYSEQLSRECAESWGGVGKTLKVMLEACEKADARR